MKTSSSLRATFLGTAAGNTSLTREHSGLLLEADGASLLLDCGGNVARHLHAGGSPSEVPTAIWISHMHSDHVGQFSMLIQSLWLRQRRAPLHVFGPAEVLRVLEDWLVRCILFPGLIGFPIQWRPVQPGVPVTEGPFTLTAFATEHLASLAAQFQKEHPATCFDCYGVAIDVHGRRCVYSADLAHPRELAPALAGREVAALFCELSHYPEQELFRTLAPYAIESLWLTHYCDDYTGQEKKLKLIAQEENFKGSVHLLQDKVAEEI